MSEEQESYADNLNAEDNKNLSLWRKVEKTPLSQIKTANMGGRNVKSVNPQYQRLKATEVLGLYGCDWGVKNESFIKDEYQDNTVLLDYSADFYFTFDGKKGEYPISAQVKQAYTTSKGKYFIDDQAKKKVATDALTKGLSFLGFNADVFQGLHDDAAYIMSLQQDEEYAANITAIDNKAEYMKKKGRIQGDIATAQKLTDLDKIVLAAIKEATEIGDTNFIVKLDELKTKRIEELKQKAEKQK